MQTVLVLAELEEGFWAIRLGLSWIAIVVIAVVTTNAYQSRSWKLAFKSIVLMSWFTVLLMPWDGFVLVELSDPVDPRDDEVIYLSNWASSFQVVAAIWATELVAITAVARIALKVERAKIECVVLTPPSSSPANN